MKITVEKGIDVKQAISYVKEFLTNKSEEYPILKSNLNIYISLCNEEGEVIKENQSEYYISEKELGEFTIKDIRKEKEDLAKKNIFKNWKEFVFAQKVRIKDLEGEILLDKTYLHNAKVRKRKQENIDKRKNSLKEKENRLEDEIKKNKLLNKLENAFNEGYYSLYYKEVEGSKKGSEKVVKAYIVFNKSVLGNVIHFDGFNIKKNYPK